MNELTGIAKKECARVMKKTSKVASVERALKILDAFEEGSDRLTLADLARRTKIVKPTLLRLMDSFLDRGLIERNEDGSYVIGSASLRLVGLHKRAANNERAIVSVLDRLVAKFGETASFSVRQGDFRVYVYRTNSGYRLRDHVHPGDLSPVRKGATGHILRAFTELDDKSFEASRQKMYAVSKGEMEAGTVGVSSPIFDAHGKLLGAISLSGPAFRIDDEKLQAFIRDLIEAAKALTLSFGGRANAFDDALAALAESEKRANVDDPKRSGTALNKRPKAATSPTRKPASRALTR